MQNFIYKILNYVLGILYLFSAVFPAEQPAARKMKKFLLLTLISVIVASHISAAQSVKLTAIYDTYNSAVKLNWNMVNNGSRTSYLLLRSSDGISWTEAAKDRMLRYYTEDDIYFFNDRNYLPGKNFYRIRISDAANNTIALSPVVIVYTNGQASSATTKPSATIKNNTITRQVETTRPVAPQPQNNSNSWVIYPNPATDVLTLTYRGSATLKGVVNVQIQDASGKVVVKFRSGSMYKTIQIPISNLQRGAYFIQVSVLSELMMNQRFIKQ